MVNMLGVQTVKAPDMEVNWNQIAQPMQNALSSYREGMNQQYAEGVRKENQTYQRGRDAKQDADNVWLT